MKRTPAYPYCGMSGDLSTKWTNWDDWPDGWLVVYNHGYLITTTTYTCATATYTGAIGAAVGYMGWFEIAATLLIGGILIMCGCSKPTTKEASFFNLLKGAGVAEIDKNQQKVEELERKVNELIAAQGGASTDPPAVASSLVNVVSDEAAPTLAGMPLPAAAQLPPPPQQHQPSSPPPPQQTSPQQPLEQESGFCGGCGAPMKPDVRFCNKCGHKRN